MFRLLSLSCLLSVSAVFATKTINVVNNCSIGLDIYFDHTFNGSVVSKGTLAFDVNSDYEGQISVSSNKWTYAGIYLLWDYYYIVRNSSHFTTGVSIIAEDQSPANGFCPIASCDSANCTTAFDSQPDLTEMDPVPGIPPTSPMYGCGYEKVFNVTWCPNGAFPDQSSLPRAVHPMGDATKCLNVQGNKLVNGDPVQVFDCNGSPGQQWLLSRGETRVKLAGTGFCLDASRKIENGSGVKIWKCHGLPQQVWTYTADDQLSVTGREKCLDVRNGNTTNGNQLQIWECTRGDPNQVFTV